MRLPDCRFLTNCDNFEPFSILKPPSCLSVSFVILMFNLLNNAVLYIENLFALWYNSLVTKRLQAVLSIKSRRRRTWVQIYDAPKENCFSTVINQPLLPSEKLPLLRSLLTGQPTETYISTYIRAAVPTIRLPLTTVTSNLIWKATAYSHKTLWRQF